MIACSFYSICWADADLWDNSWSVFFLLSGSDGDCVTRRSTSLRVFLVFDWRAQRFLHASSLRDGLGGDFFESNLVKTSPGQLGPGRLLCNEGVVPPHVPSGDWEVLPGGLQGCYSFDLKPVRINSWKQPRVFILEDYSVKKRMLNHFFTELHRIMCAFLS